MLRVAALAVALSLALPAMAQGLRPAVGTVDLKLTMEQAQLIVQMLGRVACPDVQSWVICRSAAELLEEMKRQIRAEVRR